MASTLINNNYMSTIEDNQTGCGNESFLNTVVTCPNLNNTNETTGIHHGSKGDIDSENGAASA